VRPPYPFGFGAVAVAKPIPVAAVRRVSALRAAAVGE
jgi:hypothetical protein